VLKITNPIVIFKMLIYFFIIPEFASKYTISIYSECQTISDFNNGCVDTGTLDLPRELIQGFSLVFLFSILNQ